MTWVSHRPSSTIHGEMAASRVSTSILAPQRVATSAVWSPKYSGPLGHRADCSTSIPDSMPSSLRVSSSIPSARRARAATADSRG